MAEVYKSSKSINTPKGGAQKNTYSANKNSGNSANKNTSFFNKKNNNQKNNMQQQNNLKNQNQGNGEDLNMQQKIKKKAAKETLTTAAKAYNPALGAAVEKVLETRKGNEYLDEFAKADSTNEGIKKVAKKFKDEERKKRMRLTILSIAGPFFIFLFLFLLLFAKNADSQTYSNVNDGEVIIGEDDTFETNIFLKYPGLYEKITKETQKVADKYKVTLDRHLVVATLVAPLTNDYITPVEGDCGSETNECYWFKGKLYNWEDFLALWAEQSELLAKMQIMTYVDTLSSSIKVDCGEEETMEQFAKNDLKQGATSFWSFLDIFNLFGSYRDEKDAELNARCTDAPPGKSRVPDVYVLSKDQGHYYNSVDADGNHTYVKEPDSGGVYFWNLVNKGGFVDTYFKDYLTNIEGKSEDELYEINLPRILDIANYIYSYYEGIRKDCNGYEVIESTIEKIKVKHKNDDGYDLIDFEEQYVGGVIMAEFASGGLEAEKAMAILARTEAVAVVGVDGEGIIENSSNNQNYNGAAYNPTYDPKYENQEDNPNYDPDWPKKNLPLIWQAVQETKGVVITDYGKIKVKHTEYDAFCPQDVRLSSDGFYYLDQAQRELPISPGAWQQKTGRPFTISDRWLECACFYNPDSRPNKDTMSGVKQKVKFNDSPTNPPTEPDGYPKQPTNASCWTYRGQQDGKFGWSYKPSGGHGRGVSQYGLKYFEAFGYKWDGLIGLSYPAISYRKLSSSIEPGECENASRAKEGKGGSNVDSCGVTFEISDSNYNTVEGGNPLNEPLTEALEKNGYDIDCLNGCIEQRVQAVGDGTREAAVEAAVGLIECTMKMTGGFTYPYDHRGGYPPYNEDINGKKGVNSKWGEYASFATGCQGTKCRLGLNCANFVRWSMCNGGQMPLCSKGSTFATGMAGVLNRANEDYFPGAVRVRLTPSFSVIKGSFSGSKEDAINKIQPGDVLYSDHSGSGNHVMMIVGVTSDSITIAENGRKTRRISKSELRSSSMTYIVLLLDGFYGSSGE